MKEILLIVGHGSRSKDAQETFNSVVDMVRVKSENEFFKVDGAHMELAHPSIEEKVKALAAQGVNRILMVPYFLYEGIHIKEDIPELIEKLNEEYPKIEFRLGRPIGKEPLLADLLINRGKELK
jgi:sirohydrochlorin cobaltochelatase